jgi:hypothetical protein
MAYLASLPAGAVLLDMFRAYPQTARPLPDYHQALLRGASPLAVAERELIAAYVQGLTRAATATVCIRPSCRRSELTKKHWARCWPTSRLVPAGGRMKLGPLRNAVNARWSSSPFGAQRAMVPNLSVGGAVTPSMSGRPG